MIHHTNVNLNLGCRCSCMQPHPRSSRCILRWGAQSGGWSITACRRGSSTEWDSLRGSVGRQWEVLMKARWFRTFQRASGGTSGITSASTLFARWVTMTSFAPIIKGEKFVTHSQEELRLQLFGVALIYKVILLQVPLFQHMDELVLENICDRVKSLIFTKGEIVSSLQL